MRLGELLRSEDCLVPLEARDKWDAITLLLGHLAEHGRIPAARLEELADLVLARERSMSTGMERGIAIPHAAVDKFETIVGALGIVHREEGLAFESIDARPTHLVVLLLIPRAQKLAHIRTLADIARTLGREEVRTALLAAPAGPAAWQILLDAERTQES